MLWLVYQSVSQSTLSGAEPISCLSVRCMSTVCLTADATSPPPSPVWCRDDGLSVDIDVMTISTVTCPLSSPLSLAPTLIDDQ